MKAFPWNSLDDFVTTFFRLGLGISIQFHSEAWLWLSDLFGAHFLQINCWIFVVLRRNTFFQTFLELVSELDLCFPIIRFSSNALKLSWMHFFSNYSRRKLIIMASYWKCQKFLRLWNFLTSKLLWIFVENLKGGRKSFVRNSTKFFRFIKLTPKFSGYLAYNVENCNRTQFAMHFFNSQWRKPAKSRFLTIWHNFVWIFGSHIWRKFSQVWKKSECQKCFSGA